MENVLGILELLATAESFPRDFPHYAVFLILPLLPSNAQVTSQHPVLVTVLANVLTLKRGTQVLHPRKTPGRIIVLYIASLFAYVVKRVGACEILIKVIKLK